MILLVTLFCLFIIIGLYTDKLSITAYISLFVGIIAIILVYAFIYFVFKGIY
jgi:Na+-transporting NADH:ubiquinone oxidoreductase subunit NqrB